MQAMLSSDERAVVAKYPIGTDLDSLRHQLDTSVRDTRFLKSKGIKAAPIIWQMLVTLMVQEAAFHLMMRNRRESVSSGLGRLFALIDFDINSGTCANRHYQLLAQVIIDREPDTEIWEAVITTIESQLLWSSEQSDALSAPAEPRNISSRPQSVVSRLTRARAVANKVSVADAVQNNDFFFPFDPRANPRSLHRQREEFTQAVLRDLDRIYIRVVDQVQCFKAFDRITRDVKALGPDFPLWQFELVVFHIVKDLDVESGDFEVFRGLQAWKNMEVPVGGRHAARTGPTEKACHRARYKVIPSEYRCGLPQKKSAGIAYSKRIIASPTTPQAW